MLNISFTFSFHTPWICMSALTRSCGSNPPDCVTLTCTSCTVYHYVLFHTSDQGNWRSHSLHLSVSVNVLMRSEYKIYTWADQRNWDEFQLLYQSCYNTSYLKQLKSLPLQFTYYLITHQRVEYQLFSDIATVHSVTYDQ